MAAKQFLFFEPAVRYPYIRPGPPWLPTKTDEQLGGIYGHLAIHERSER